MTRCNYCEELPDDCLCREAAEVEAVHTRLAASLAREETLRSALEASDRERNANAVAMAQASTRADRASGDVDALLTRAMSAEAKLAEACAELSVACSKLPNAEDAAVAVSYMCVTALSNQPDYAAWQRVTAALRLVSRHKAPGVDADSMLDLSVPDVVIHTELRAMGLDPEALAAKGAELVVKAQSVEQCEDCGGTGFDGLWFRGVLQEKTQCPACNGTGRKGGE